MVSSKEYRFSGPVKVFHDHRLPEQATPVGYAALVDACGLQVPIPRTMTAIGSKHRVYEQDRWRIRTPRHMPAATVEGHLTFALKYEGLDLAVLKRLFDTVGEAEIEALVRSTPTGIYARRLWFLYEWLTGETLKLSDARGSVSYTDAVDTALQFAAPGANSPRHRVRNNLPGSQAFCPLVFRTNILEEYLEQQLVARAQEVVAAVPRDVLARTASFLLLKDSKSSFAIEGERPPQERIQRWGRAIGEAGKNPLDENELIRMQEIVIGDSRFVFIGLRADGGFVGEHDRVSQLPLPEHISARPEDLPDLVDGMIRFERGQAMKMDPVIAAAVLAFGFIYVHPFEDGNGRIHRYLIHHVLAQRGFNPSGVVFPVSAAILANIADYKRVLSDYSKRLMPLIEWQPTDKNNVLVTNDTADFYRYFDATPHAEFLYRCVRQTIEKDLPEETDFLLRYDRFRLGLEAVVDMPDRTANLLFRFLQQNNGLMSKRTLTTGFEALSREEVTWIEALYRQAFDK